MLRMKYDDSRYLVNTGVANNSSTDGQPNTNIFPPTMSWEHNERTIQIKK